MGGVGERGMTHDFQESLAKSHAAEDHPVWEQIYRTAFPDFAAMVNHRSDGPHQRAGIDRSVILSNAKQLMIDEKARYKNAITGKVYDDILLEVWSDECRKIEGWVSKPLLADYIAYAILPLGKCYLLPVIQLQAAWQKHGAFWRSGSREIRAQNNGWITVSCAVEPAVLFKAIGACLRVVFNPVEAS
jgi:hypothetical protein